MLTCTTLIYTWERERGNMICTCNTDLHGRCSHRPNSARQAESVLCVYITCLYNILISPFLAPILKSTREFPELRL